MNNITVIGIDIAKNVLQIHGMDSAGKKVLQKRIDRGKFLTYMANLPQCLVGMEACGGAQYWATQLIKLGFEVRLMPPRKVKKYAEHHKNDARDAAACAEAVTRASMTFVTIKTDVQLDLQAIHRTRSFYIKERTRLTNMTRGLLAERGIVMPKGEAAFVNKIQALLGDENFTGEPRELLNDLYEMFKIIDEKVERHTDKLKKIATEDAHCRQLDTILGIGPITATALVAKIGNGSEFKRGRELSAYLGLVPKQHSSGDKQSLHGISKNGDRYIRQLLIHGGRSCLVSATRINKITKTFEKQDAHSQWIREIINRVGMNKASVAVANKNARIAIAVLKKQEAFNPALAHMDHFNQ